MGSRAQTGLLMVPSDALGHTWGRAGYLPPETGMRDLESAGELLKHTQRAGCLGTCYGPEGWAGGVHTRRKDRAEILLLRGRAFS